MIKSRELTDPTSCLNKARADELLFVLLARDAAAPVAIRAWIAERVRLGKNQMGDAQIMEAFECAQRMERSNPCHHEYVGPGWVSEFCSLPKDHEGPHRYGEP